MQSLERELMPYRYFWTTHKDDYLLFTIRYCGEDTCLIFHKPTKRVVVTHSERLDRAIIERMKASGVPVLNDPPA